MMRKILTASVLPIFLFAFFVHAAPPPRPKPSKPATPPTAPKASPKEIMSKIDSAQQAPPSKVVVFSEAEIAIKKQRAKELIEVNPAVSAVAKDPQLLADLLRDKSFRDRYFEYESDVQVRKDVLEFLKLQSDLKRAKKQESNFIVSTRSILQAARAAGNLPDGAVFRMVDAKEVEMLMRDGYVTATAYPNNPSLAGVKSDIGGIVQSPQALQRALIHHDTGNGADSFMKSATVSEKKLLTTIASYAESYPEQYVLVLNPKRALINQFNMLWQVEGEVVFPGYIELGTDVIGYMNPQTGKYISLAKKPVINPSTVATVRDFQVLVDGKSFDKNMEKSFVESHKSPFIDPTAFKAAAKAYENMPVNNDKLRHIAPLPANPMNKALDQLRDVLQK